MQPDHRTRPAWLKTKIIGVTAENAAAFALSFAAGKAVQTDTANTFADGMACRNPQQEPLDIILKGAEDVVTVSEGQIAELWPLTTRTPIIWLKEQAQLLWPH